MHAASFRLLTFAILVCSLETEADNWPAWRGPFGTGKSTEKRFPVEWSREKNVRWRIDLPERGNSSPIVWGNKIFVTQSLEGRGLRQLICFDRKNGKTLWKKSVEFELKEPTHRTNPYCSASPVTDGKRVIVSHASAGVFCYDLNGRKLWHRNLGEQKHIWGNGASPVMYKDICFLNFGPGPRTFLVALNVKDGKTIWQHNETGGDSGITKDGEKGKWIGSWTTPIVIDGKKGDEILMAYPGRVVGFDPLKGKEIWNCGGLNPLIYTSPLYEDGLIVVLGGFRGTAMAVRAGGVGNVTATHQLWTRPKEKQRIGSGVLVGGHVYILNEDGVAQCIEARKGKVVWEERLRGSGKNGKSWSSVVVTGDKLYAINQSGDAFILRASPKFELSPVNSLGEVTQSSMAFSDGDIFIRTYKSLWCIGKK